MSINIKMISDKHKKGVIFLCKMQYNNIVQKNLRKTIDFSENACIIIEHLRKDIAE